MFKSAVAEGTPVNWMSQLLWWVGGDVGCSDVYAVTERGFRCFWLGLELQHLKSVHLHKKIELQVRMTIRAFCTFYFIKTALM